MFTHHQIRTQHGIGLRAPHYREILERKPPFGWFEVHSENFFGAGGQPLWFLRKIREIYPFSLHGVGLSLGSIDALSHAHLERIKSLIERFEPALVSDHLCWGSANGRHLNDLLPLPYTEEALAHVCRRVDEIQNFLQRQFLIENVSSYLQYVDSSIPEWEFVAEVARRTGCGILLDVNNVYVSAVNHGFDPLVYLRAIPAEHVKEIHLAGFDSNGEILIDTHGKRVYEAVWTLYRITLERIGNRPTLIEWDTDIPALDVLLQEADHAANLMREVATPVPADAELVPA